MNFTCPNPACKTGWRWPESRYYGGTPFSCDKCEKKYTIPLYCPHCCPPSVEDKRFLPTRSGFLGGEAFRCASCGKEYTVPVTRSELYDRMSSMGTELGQYRQGERIATLPNERLKSVVKGGYCAGVVYDWIRRLLLGGKSTYSDSKIRQDVRVAYAWTQYRPEKQKAFLDTKDGTLTDLVNQKIQLESAAARQQIADLDAKIDGVFDRINQMTDISDQQRSEYCRKAQAAYDKGIADIYAERDLKIDEAKGKLETWRAKPSMTRFWDEFAGIMDAYLAKDRLTRGKAGDSARQFSDLRLVKEVSSATHNGLASLINALISDPEFKTNRAAWVSVNPPITGASGHAIGVFRQNTGRYYLFDPNIGTYELDAANLRETFVYIFLKAYPNMGGGDTSDNHHYEIEGKTKGGYQIFEGDRVSVPSVTPITKPVVNVKVTPPVLSPMPLPVKFEPIVSTKPIPPIVGKQKVMTTSTPPPTTNTGTPTPQTGGSKVSALINKFNK